MTTMSPVIVSGDGSSGVMVWEHRRGLIPSSKASCGSSFEFSPWHEHEQQRRACMSVAEDLFSRSGRIRPLSSPSPSAVRDSSDDDDCVAYNPRQETPNSFLVRSGSILGSLQLSPDADARRKRADLEETEDEEDEDEDDEEEEEDPRCPSQPMRDEPETSSDDFFSSDADSTRMAGSSRNSSKKRLTLGELINFGTSSSGSDNELQKQRLLQSSSSRTTVKNVGFMQWLQRSKSSGSKQDQHQQQKQKELQKKDGLQGSRRGMERSMSSGIDRRYQQQQEATVVARAKSESLLVQALCGSKKGSDISSVAVMNNAAAPADLRRSGSGSSSSSSRRPPAILPLNRNHISAAGIPPGRLQRSNARRSCSGGGEYVWTPSRSPLSSSSSSSSDRSLQQQQQQQQQRNFSTKQYSRNQIPRSKSSGSTFFRSTSTSRAQLDGGGGVSRDFLTKSRSTGGTVQQLQQLPLLGKSKSRAGSRAGNKLSSSSGRKSFTSASLPGGRPLSDSAVAMDRYNKENKEELRRTSYLPYKRALLSFFPANFLWPRRQQASGAAAATLVSAPAHHHRCHYF